MIVFRHLMSTPYRTVLVGQLDKLLDDRVLFGTGLASKEMVRCANCNPPPTQNTYIFQS